MIHDTFYIPTNIDKKMNINSNNNNNNNNSDTLKVDTFIKSAYIQPSISSVTTSSSSTSNNNNQGLDDHKILLWIQRQLEAYIALSIIPSLLSIDDLGHGKLLLCLIHRFKPDIMLNLINTIESKTSIECLLLADHLIQQYWNIPIDSFVHHLYQQQQQHDTSYYSSIHHLFNQFNTDSSSSSFSSSSSSSTSTFVLSPSLDYNHNNNNLCSLPMLAPSSDGMNEESGADFNADQNLIRQRLLKQEVEHDGDNDNRLWIVSTHQSIQKFMNQPIPIQYHSLLNLIQLLQQIQLDFIRLSTASSTECQAHKNKIDSLQQLINRLASFDQDLYLINNTSYHYYLMDLLQQKYKCLSICVNETLCIYQHAFNVQVWMDEQLDYLDRVKNKIQYHHQSEDDGEAYKQLSAWINDVTHYRQTNIAILKLEHCCNRLSSSSSTSSTWSIVDKLTMEMILHTLNRFETLIPACQSLLKSIQFYQDQFKWNQLCIKVKETLHQLYVSSQSLIDQIQWKNENTQKDLKLISSSSPFIQHKQQQQQWKILSKRMMKFHENREHGYTAIVYLYEQLVSQSSSFKEIIEQEYQTIQKSWQELSYQMNKTRHILHQQSEIIDFIDQCHKINYKVNTFEQHCQDLDFYHDDNIWLVDQVEIINKHITQQLDVAACILDSNKNHVKIMTAATTAAISLTQDDSEWSNHHQSVEYFMKEWVLQLQTWQSLCATLLEMYQQKQGQILMKRELEGMKRQLGDMMGQLQSSYSFSHINPWLCPSTSLFILQKEYHHFYAFFIKLQTQWETQSKNQNDNGSHEEYKDMIQSIEKDMVLLQQLFLQQRQSLDLLEKRIDWEQKLTTAHTWMNQMVNSIHFIFPSVFSSDKFYNNYQDDGNNFETLEQQLAQHKHLLESEQLSYDILIGKIDENDSNHNNKGKNNHHHYHYQQDEEVDGLKIFSTESSTTLTEFTLVTEASSNTTPAERPVQIDQRHQLFIDQTDELYRLFDTVRTVMNQQNMIGKFTSLINNVDKTSASLRKQLDHATKQPCQLFFNENAESSHHQHHIQLVDNNNNKKNMNEAIENIETFVVNIWQQAGSYIPYSSSYLAMGDSLRWKAITCYDDLLVSTLHLVEQHRVYESRQKMALDHWYQYHTLLDKVEGVLLELNVFMKDDMENQFNLQETLNLLKSTYDNAQSILSSVDSMLITLQQQEDDNDTLPIYDDNTFQLLTARYENMQLLVNNVFLCLLQTIKEEAQNEHEIILNRCQQLYNMDFFDVEDNNTQNNTFYLIAKQDDLFAEHRSSQSIHYILTNMLLQCQRISLYDYDSCFSYQQIMDNLTSMVTTEKYIFDTMIRRAIEFGKEASRLYHWMDDTRLCLVEFGHQEQQKLEEEGAKDLHCIDMHWKLDLRIWEHRLDTFEKGNYREFHTNIHEWLKTSHYQIKEEDAKMYDTVMLNKIYEHLKKCVQFMVQGIDVSWQELKDVLQHTLTTVAQFWFEKIMDQKWQQFITTIDKSCDHANDLVSTFHYLHDSSNSSEDDDGNDDNTVMMMMGKESELITTEQGLFKLEHETSILLQHQQQAIMDVMKQYDQCTYWMDQLDIDNAMDRWKSIIDQHKQHIRYNINLCQYWEAAADVQGYLTIMEQIIEKNNPSLLIGNNNNSTTKAFTIMDGRAILIEMETRHKIYNEALDSCMEKVKQAASSLIEKYSKTDYKKLISKRNKTEQKYIERIQEWKQWIESQHQQLQQQKHDVIGRSRKISLPSKLPPTPPLLPSTTSRRRISSSTSASLSPLFNNNNSTSSNSNNINNNSSSNNNNRIFMGRKSSLSNLKPPPPNSYVADPKNDLDIEIGRIVNRVPYKIELQMVPGEVGRYWFGNKLVFCRILRSRMVMVRVGGGWTELSQFLRDHALLVNDAQKLMMRRNSSIDYNNNNSSNNGGYCQETFLETKRAISPNSGRPLPRMSQSSSTNTTSSITSKAGFKDGDRYFAVDNDGHQHEMIMTPHDHIRRRM
ncbi:hypothetical protein BJ944DRAFT_248769 [Cunninghamella echinulata]|nr:hypothetical protein BJ944DRAFT_248769 [Cunninghamella echinulata]